MCKGPAYHLPERLASLLRYVDTWATLTLEPGSVLVSFEPFVVSWLKAATGRLKCAKFCL